MSTKRAYNREEKRFNKAFDCYLKQYVKRVENLKIDHSGDFKKDILHAEFYDNLTDDNSDFNHYIKKWNAKSKYYKVPFNKLEKTVRGYVKNERIRQFTEYVALLCNDNYDHLFHEVIVYQEDINKCIESGFTPEEVSIYIHEKIKKQ